MSDQTLLFLAVLSGRLSKIDALLQHGAHIDAVDDQGLTPLHMRIAVLYSDEDVERCAQIVDIFSP